MEKGLKNPGAMRTMLFSILLVGVLGTALDLILLQHNDDAAQFIPFVVLGLGFAVIVWHLVSETTASRLAMRFTMVAFVAAGVLGMALHYRGNVQFQKEIDPTIHGYALFDKAIHAKAPPALAPSAMAWFGLLGFACTYLVNSKGERR